jgi:hypothetical protein
MNIWRRGGLCGLALIGLLVATLASMPVHAERLAPAPGGGGSGPDVMVAETPPPYIGRDLKSSGAPIPWTSQSSSTTKSSGGDGKSSPKKEGPRNSARAKDSKANAELEKVAKDPVVSAAIDKAWKDSRPTDGSAKMEHGFWIVKDSKGKLSVVPYKVISSKQDQIVFDGTPPPGAIASFHTHPNKPDEAPAGFEYITAPSPEDLATAKDINLPGIIQSTSGMYYYDP